MKYEESDRVELKREMIKDLDKEIIAFLNARGGTIYIGVDDKGNIAGVPQELKDEYDEKVSAVLTNNIKPNSRNKVDFSYNEDDVLAIHVKEGDSKPYYLTEKGPKPSGTYIRVGRSKRPADDDEILTMIRDSSGWLWENQISNEQVLTFDVLTKFVNRKNLVFNRSKYKTLKLINEKGEFTNVGLLLSDQNPIEVKFAVYDKNMNFKIKKEFQGSIISIADEVLNYSELFNDTSAKIIPGQISRVETKSYPGVSLREGIINAICHADYSLPSNIKVEFFRDKVRIINPGNVYNSTLEAVLGGVQTFRNPALVNVLYKLGFIENYGTGLQRIIEAYENEELKPEFKVIDRYFFLTLPNLNKDSYSFEANDAQNEAHNSTISSTNNSTIDSTVRLSKTQVAILTLIKENKYITTTEISNKLNKELSTIKKSIKVLKDAGILARIGTNRSGHWEIAEEEKGD